MLVATNRGYLSVIAKDRDGKVSGSGPNAIVSVRFRRKRDAAAFFPMHDVVMMRNGDYGCRVFVTRAELAKAVAVWKVSEAKAGRSLPDAL